MQPCTQAAQKGCKILKVSVPPSVISGLCNSLIPLFGRAPKMNLDRVVQGSFRPPFSKHSFNCSELLNNSGPKTGYTPFQYLT